MRVQRSPTFICITPSSQPRITCCMPMLNCKGARRGRRQGHALIGVQSERVPQQVWWLLHSSAPAARAAPAAAHASARLPPHAASRTHHKRIAAVARRVELLAVGEGAGVVHGDLRSVGWKVVSDVSTRAPPGGGVAPAHGRRRRRRCRRAAPSRLPLGPQPILWLTLSPCLGEGPVPSVWTLRSRLCATMEVEIGRRAACCTIWRRGARRGAAARRIERPAVAVTTARAAEQQTRALTIVTVRKCCDGRGWRPQLDGRHVHMGCQAGSADHCSSGLARYSPLACILIMSEQQQEPQPRRERLDVPQTSALGAFGGLVDPLPFEHAAQTTWLHATRPAELPTEQPQCELAGPGPLSLHRPSTTCRAQPAGG